LQNKNNNSSTYSQSFTRSTQCLW